MIYWFLQSLSKCVLKIYQNPGILRALPPPQCIFSLAVTRECIGVANGEVSTLSLVAKWSVTFLEIGLPSISPSLWCTLCRFHTPQFTNTGILKFHHNDYVLHSRTYSNNGWCHGTVYVTRCCIESGRYLFFHIFLTSFFSSLSSVTLLWDKCFLSTIMLFPLRCLFFFAAHVFQPH